MPSMTALGLLSSHKWRERSRGTLTEVNGLKQQQEGNNESRKVLTGNEMKTSWVFHLCGLAPKISVHDGGRIIIVADMGDESRLRVKRSDPYTLVLMSVTEHDRDMANNWSHVDSGLHCIVLW
jgi:hypothetical protein